MRDPADTNAAIWKSADVVKSFAAQAEQRERERREQLVLVARLLPFKRNDTFTFLDLGAGTGAASRAVLSALSIHHLPDARKRTIFGEIRERLKPNGWYINYDPVRAPDASIEAAWERVNDVYDPDGPYTRK